MSDARLRIAMFCHNYLPHPGGLEIMVWNLARGLARRHEVVLVTSAYDGSRGVSQEDGFTVHRLPAIHVTEALSVPYPVMLGAGVRDALRATAGADVVHVHGALYQQTMLGLRVARRAGAPVVLTEHVGFVEYKRAALNAVQRLAWRTIGDRTARQADALVALSARVHDWLADRFARDVTFVGNGVDFDRFRPRSFDERMALRRSFGLPTDEVLALFAGRVAAKKNIDVALDAPRETFTLVLCGGKRDVKGDRLIDLGLLPHERMADLFACVDLTVHSASGEGFPLAVQESVASGTPVVLLWDDGYARWMPKELVVACDDASSIAPAIAALAGDPARRASLALTGRRWAEEQWSWEANVAAYEEIYRDVIERTRKR